MDKSIAAGAAASFAGTDTAEPRPAAARELPVGDDDAQPMLIARRLSYADGFQVAPHWHGRAQFLYAITGTMVVRTPRRAWIVPPSRALWIPARTVHEIEMHGAVEMRSVYISETGAAGMSACCVVLEVTALLRELVLRLSTLPAGDAGEHALLTPLLLAEIQRLPACALDLPLPASADLLGLCHRIMADLSTRRPCDIDAGALNISARTLYRRFLHETGLSFARWKQQARLLEAIRRLSDGASVTAVALDLGYESPSAFSTMFRRSLGMAPRVFLAGNRGG